MNQINHSRIGLIMLVLLVSAFCALVFPVSADDGYSGGYMQMPTWLYNQRIAEGATDTFTSNVVGGPLPTATPGPTYESYLTEGDTALEGGSYRDAIKAYERAIGLKPKSFDAWLGKGLALEGLKRYQSAIDAFDSALGLRKSGEKVWAAYGGKARSSLALNKYEEAIALFEKAIKSYESSGADDGEAYQALEDGLANATAKYGGAPAS